MHHIDLTNQWILINGRYNIFFVHHLVYKVRNEFRVGFIVLVVSIIVVMDTPIDRCRDVYYPYVVVRILDYVYQIGSAFNIQISVINNHRTISSYTFFHHTEHLRFGVYDIHTNVLNVRPWADR